MNRRYNDDRDDSGDDREISLGATSILGIFFALVLVCAACFGVGYSMRGRQTPSPVAATQTQSPDTPSGTGQVKPSPGSLEPAPATASTPEDSPAIVPTDGASTETASTPSAAPAVKPVVSARASARPVALGSAVVQVAAVSHMQDADFLIAALKKRGYTAAIRQEPQDKLLHVQLGPFASKKDAVATRDRLLTDGYNPIIK